MYNTLMMAHSGWRWLVVLIGVIFLVKMLLGLVQKGKWGKLDRQLGLFTTIAVDIQVLLGLIIWVMGSWWTAGGANPRSFEHPFLMLAALGVMHVGWGRAKKASTDAGKFRQALIWFGIAALLVTLGILRVSGGMA